MQLDNRSRTIFDELMENPSTNSKELEEGYSLTRRQLGYSFDKINGWLQAKHLPIIERTRQGHFIIDHSIFLNYGNGETIASSQMTVISGAQRVQMIILMLLSKQEELSLLHFTSALDVSKNTVLSDLNEARVWVEEYDLVIRYSRRDGYLLEGEEFSVRRLLINTIYKVLAIPNGKKRLKELANIHEKELEEFTVRLEKIERKLNLKFEDAEIEAMPYSLLLVLRRMIDNKIETSFSIQYEELSDTKEYQATEEILFDIKDIPVQERLFITLRLLTTNVYWSEAQQEEPIPNLAQALDEMLRLFEASAVVKLQDRQQLLTKILLHLKPAYYRIKYQLTEINDVGYKLMKDEYKELYHLVSQSTKPLAALIGTAIPPSEMAYLTMLIGGWLRKQGDNLHEKVKAIVVCPTDVSGSRVMFNELRELFPEFVFLDVVSVREFHSSTLDYDIVFSPFFLETDKKLYLANSFLKYEDMPRLRKHVLFDLHGYIPYEVNVDEMMTIVEKHVTIHNEAFLRRELHAYIDGLGRTK